MPQPDPFPSPEPEPGRRGVLGGLAAVVAAIAAAVGIPSAVLFAGPALKANEDDGTWVPVGPAADFGEERKEVVYSFTQQDGWYAAARTRRVLVGKEGDDWIVFSTKCTHVGCGVTWKPDQKQFFCPCHGGVFDQNGQRVAGPPKKPLTRLEARVNADTGLLEVKES